jgi:hypothetical protein
LKENFLKQAKFDKNLLIRYRKLIIFREKIFGQKINFLVHSEYFKSAHVLQQLHFEMPFNFCTKAPCPDTLWNPITFSF